LSLGGSGALTTARGTLLNRDVSLNHDVEPDVPTSSALAALEVATQQAWRTGTSARLLANVRELFQAVGSGWGERSGSSSDIRAPDSAAPRTPRSSGLASQRRGANEISGRVARGAAAANRRLTGPGSAIR
jgi:hypothetical protein